MVPQDIEALMRSDSGRWALKAVEGHGGIWRWRQRPYVVFDHVALQTARGMDTAIANRGRDTTITPKVDTLLNVHENCTFDLKSGKRFSRSATQSPQILAGNNGQSDWCMKDGVLASSDTVSTVGRQLLETSFWFQLPFQLIDTTLRLSLLGEIPTKDTVVTKGKESGTFDTTITDYSITRLKVEWPAGRAPVEWMVFYLDGRDGRVRRTLSPVVRRDGSRSAWLTVWSDMVDAVGLKVGGRRLSYPATSEGQVTGPYELDRRFYNPDFPRELETVPFDPPQAH
jgi:hypothetical protein